MPDIDVVLVEGDALSRAADFAIIGRGGALINQVERESGSRFEPFRYEFPFGVRPQQLWRTRLLTAEDFLWRNVASLSGRAGRRVRHAFHQEWIELMLAGLTRFEPKRVLIVPYSHKHPDTVAAVTLFHIWFYSKMNWADLTGVRKHVPQRFEIVDRKTVDAFRRCLSDEQNLGTFIRRELLRISVAPKLGANESLGMRVLSPNDVV